MKLSGLTWRSCEGSKRVIGPLQVGRSTRYPATIETPGQLKKWCWHVVLDVFSLSLSMLASNWTTPPKKTLQNNFGRVKSRYQEQSDPRLQLQFCFVLASHIYLDMFDVYLKKDTSFCSFLVHDSVSTFTTTNRISRFDLVFCMAF